MSEIDDYDELKELIFTKQGLKLPIINQVNLYEKKIANILRTQRKRIYLDIKHDEIIIDITRNRNVTINNDKIQQLQKLFKARDVAISSPIRCKLIIKMIRGKKHGKKVLAHPNKNHKPSSRIVWRNPKTKH